MRRKRKPPLNPPRGRTRNAPGNGSPLMRGDVDRQRGAGKYTPNPLKGTFRTVVIKKSKQ